MNVTTLPRFRVVPDLDDHGRSVWLVYDAETKRRYATDTGTIGAALEMSRLLNGSNRLADDVLGRKRG